MRLRGTGLKVKQQSAFATIYCPSHHPWELYYEVHKSVRNLQMPLVLMQMRFDGKVGFFGGVVEKDDSLGDTLLRELREELNFIPQQGLDGFHLICVHEIPSEEMRAYFYALQVDEATFAQVEANARGGVHYGSECMGVFRAPLYLNVTEQGADPAGLPSFIRSNFCQGVLEELICLLSTKSLITASQLHAAAAASGLDLQAMLPDP